MLQDDIWCSYRKCHSYLIFAHHSPKSLGISFSSRRVTQRFLLSNSFRAKDNIIAWPFQRAMTDLSQKYMTILSPRSKKGVKR